MVEIKETKEQKPADMAKAVEESLTRLHDMERRLHGLQGHVAGLAALAASRIPGMPPVPNFVIAPAPFEPTGPAQVPMAAYGASTTAYGSPFAFVPSLPSFGAGGMLHGTGGAPGLNVPSSSSLGQTASTGPGSWLSGAGPIVGGASGLTTTDFQKLPPVTRIPEIVFVDGGDRFVVKAELPGVRKDDVEITASEKVITIEAEIRPDLGQGTVLVGEVLPVVYRRTIPLPSACNSGKCKASLKDGFLTLEVPKKEPTESPRRLDVAYG